MDKLRKFAFLIASFLLSHLVFAQEMAARTEKRGLLESDGKIYVVLVVVLIILSGLLYYVFRLDQKISKMEKSERS